MTIRTLIALSLALFAAAAGAQAPAAGDTLAAGEKPAAAETPVMSEAPPAKQALESIETLGEANGQALACGAKQAAARARELMLQHSPRTSTYGSAFEQATQRGYLGQVQGNKPCPSEAELNVRLETIARKLRETLPQGE